MEQFDIFEGKETMEGVCFLRGLLPELNEAKIPVGGRIMWSSIHTIFYVKLQNPKK